MEDNYDGTYDGGAFTYQRNTIWWGAKKVDENFYGDSNTRWEPYSPPETEPGNGNS